MPEDHLSRYLEFEISVNQSRQFNERIVYRDNLAQADYIGYFESVIDT